jgi:hypothetical protein
MEPIDGRELTGLPSLPPPGLPGIATRQPGQGGVHHQPPAKRQWAAEMPNVGSRWVDPGSRHPVPSRCRDDAKRPHALSTAGGAETGARGDWLAGWQALKRSIPRRGVAISHRVRGWWSDLGQGRAANCRDLPRIPSPSTDHRAASWGTACVGVVPCAGRGRREGALPSWHWPRRDPYGRDIYSIPAWARCLFLLVSGRASS